MIDFKIYLKSVKGGHVENVDIPFLKERDQQKQKQREEPLENELKVLTARLYFRNFNYLKK
ncbi:MAG: hypothetical protein ACFE9N_01055 [Promethearchaeota archaeon]